MEEHHVRTHAPQRGQISTVEHTHTLAAVCKQLQTRSEEKNTACLALKTWETGLGVNGEQSLVVKESLQSQTLIYFILTGLSEHTH